MITNLKFVLMKSIVFLLLVIWPFLFFSNTSNEESYFNQLCQINKQWLNHEQDSPNAEVYFKTDEDAIQAHLFLVCNSLTKNTPSDLSDNQLESRLQLIQILREYAREKVFPTNLYHVDRTPYFVDDFGVHCAVGYLMSESGSKDLVAEIRANENYSYIADIKTPGVSEWAFEHGFTVDELKWIQPGYLPSPDAIGPIGSGTNGPVNKVVQNNYNGELVLAGKFDSLDLEPCLNIGVYDNNQLSCLGAGISGKINDVTIKGGNVVAFGELDFQGQIYTMAIYDNSQWNYMNIPSREGAVATAGFSGGIGFEVAINHPTVQNAQEIWIQSNSGNWEKELTLNGIVKKIGTSVFGRVFVGSFNEARTYDDQGAVNDTVFTNNVFFREHYGNNDWNGISGVDISDTVNTFVGINNQIYFGGTASNDGSSSGVILTRYLNNTLQPLLFAYSFSGNDPVSINALDLIQTDGSLLIGGNFLYVPMVGTGGKNLGVYNVYSHSMSYIAYLDKKVNGAVFRNGQIYFGGDFRTNLSSTELNHLGKYDTTAEVDNNSLNNKLKVFPNPFTDVIKIEGLTSKYTFQILDGSGRVVREGIISSNDSSIQLGDLTSGFYLFNLKSEKGIISKRLIKQ
ncbi:MAG: hypothetical protein COA32_14230 [Fluviicola sp.]|nr:MAG: hypothetical protein COA32_14230 [Fluviicola sp.]